MKLVLTFDIDLADYVGGWRPIDELEVAVPMIAEELGRFEGLVATWFVRIDDHVARIFGEPDYALRKYYSLFNSLRGRGHELGWHPHSYAFKGGEWRQNLDSQSISVELARLGPLARSYGMTSARMGWGAHHNETMMTLSELGFLVDSSAIPRPSYAWETTIKNWDHTPCHPYFPSKANYRVPGTPSHSILEVPMSVGRVAAPYDTESVVRYLNPAFHPDLLLPALVSHFSGNDSIVLICHPYETMPCSKAHGLISFDLMAFSRNIRECFRLCESSGGRIESLTVKDFANHWNLGHVTTP